MGMGLAQVEQSLGKSGFNIKFNQNTGSQGIA